MRIATAGGNGSVGVGFAVPINTAKTVFEQILEDGEADHAFIGVSGAGLTPDLAESFGLDDRRGALVAQVGPGSPAARAGLQPGDVIVAATDAFTGTAVIGDLMLGMAGRQGANGIINVEFELAAGAVQGAAQVVVHGTADGARDRRHFLRVR